MLARNQKLKKVDYLFKSKEHILTFLLDNQFINEKIEFAPMTLPPPEILKKIHLQPCRNQKKEPRL